MIYDIPKELWHSCKICDKKIKDLAKIYGGCGIYYTIVFTQHLEIDHNITNVEYFEKYTTRPACPCNICNQKARLRYAKWANFTWFYTCGRYPGTLKWSEEAKINRLGDKNPMYMATPWNKNKTKETNSILKIISLKKIGQKHSPETIRKMCLVQQKRTVHGHTGCKHSEKTKQTIREKTLLNIKNGVFLQNKSRPVREFELLLDKLNIRFENEKIVHYWSFDIYLIDYDVYVEIDGDYWHSNPKFYPNGPKTKSQKINYTRDMSKNNYSKKNNLKLLRFWEYDILNHPEEIECRLKEYLI